MLRLCLLKILKLLQLFALISTTFGTDDFISFADSKLSPRIVGGQEVTIFSHPYTVSIRWKNCNDCPYEHVCGGSIFNEDTIITASGCLHDAIANRLHVIAGSSYRTNSLKDRGMIFPVDEIHVHPNGKVDLALLKLSVKIPIENRFSIKSIALGSEIPKPGTLATIVGWGRISENDGAYSEHLREAHLPIVNQTDCIQKNEGMFNEKYDICAGFAEGGVDACDGDGGTPLLVDGRLVGVASRGFGCARPGKPGIYTNVIQLREWITATALGIHIAFL